jgi:hypothetical protein
MKDSVRNDLSISDRILISDFLFNNKHYISLDCYFIFGKEKFFMFTNRFGYILGTNMKEVPPLRIVSFSENFMLEYVI